MKIINVLFFLQIFSNNNDYIRLWELINHSLNYGKFPKKLYDYVKKRIRNLSIDATEYIIDENNSEIMAYLSSDSKDIFNIHSET